MVCHPLLLFFPSYLFPWERILNRNELQLIKIELRFHHGTRSSIDAPTQQIEQIQYCHRIECLVDDQQHRIITLRFGLDNSLTEAAFYLRSPRERYVRIFPAIYRNLRFLHRNIRFKSYLFLGAAKQGCTRGKTQHTAKQQCINPGFHSKTKYLLPPSTQRRKVHI